MSSKKRCIIIYTEGETEIEFYDSVLVKIKEKYGITKFNADKIVKKCLRGITKFDKKLLKKFEHEIMPKYGDYEITVFLCYDTDVFECSSKPSVDWANVELTLRKLGANNVIHIKAERCIEDVFLIDIHGICNYLKIKPISKITGQNGVEKMQNLFNKGNRIYQKGYSCDGLIDNLDMESIFEKVKPMLEPFIVEFLPNNIKNKIHNEHPS